MTGNPQAASRVVENKLVDVPAVADNKVVRVVRKVVRKLAVVDPGPNSTT